MRSQRSHFNPRAPCGARHETYTETCQSLLFQPTRPLRGATLADTEAALERAFQPTRPLRGATANLVRGVVKIHISTHAPLAGRDYYGLVRRYVFYHFNPRAPCGARRTSISSIANGECISTHAPLAGRDFILHSIDGNTVRISTHAPLAGRDRRRAVYRQPDVRFQPTRPLRGATDLANDVQASLGFQPTRPLRGATVARAAELRPMIISTHAPLAGRDHQDG